MMSWPTSSDYNQAVQNLRVTAGDEDLRAGEVARNALDLPLLWTGNFADVYKIHCPKSGNTWALKCFTRGVRGLQERYRIIAAHLEQAGLPFTVEFQYLEQGIRIAGAWFPALKMRWVEGLTLTDFVEEHLDRPKNLKMLLDLWPKLAVRLREAGIAHADLQHGNVLLVPQQRGALALRLIDYDGMYVPGLAGTRSGELGHPAYQHPQRFRDGTYSAEVDRFSHLAIYTAVHCLTIGRRDLWRQLNNGDNLLFRESDYARPAQSEAFRALWAHGDAGIRALVGRLVLACQGPLERAPLLDEILLDGKIIAIGRKEVAAVDEALSAEEAALPVPILGKPAEPAAAPGAAGQRPWWTEAQAPPGVMPANTRPATPEGTLPAPIPIIAVEPPHRRVPSLLLRALLAPVRAADKVLLGMVGQDNTILHNFLRLMAVVVLVVGLTGGWMFSQQWRAQVVAQLASEPGRVAPDEPEKPPSVPPDVPSEPGRVAPEAPERTPHLQPIAAQTVEAGKPLALAVSVEDAAEWKGKLRFSLDENAPAGATIDPQTGEFTWTPAEQQAAGNYDVTLLVAGAAGQKDRTSFTVTVTSPPLPGRHGPALKSVEFDLGNGMKLEMVLIPAGEFLMGGENEKPVHKVRITKAFYLGKYEVTQEQWQAVTGNNPSSFKGPKNPVERVSWDDCQEFFKKLNEKVSGTPSPPPSPGGRGDARGQFRLPTEAEWEYACRAGSTGEYCFGDEDTSLGDYAWYDKNSQSKTHPVGEKKPNAWGLYDIHGNVWEWCGDWYEGSYYGKSPADDPPGPAAGAYRVNRGGGWRRAAGGCRAADRYGGSPGDRGALGLRACLVPAE